MVKLHHRQLFYNLKARKYIQTYRAVLSAIWLYQIKLFGSLFQMFDG